MLTSLSKFRAPPAEGLAYPVCYIEIHHTYRPTPKYQPKCPNWFDSCLSQYPNVTLYFVLIVLKYSFDKMYILDW